MKPTTESPAAAAELRAQAEAAYQAKAAASPANLATPTPEDARALLHELQVHQIELEMQNEELRRSQHELATSRARYFDLYDLAPVGYCTVSAKGLILEANLTLATLLGVARGKLATKPFSRYILREDQDAFYLLFKKLLAVNAAASPAASLPLAPAAVELRLVKSDGTGCWTQLLATVAADEQGEKTLRLAVTDLSAKRTREAAAQLESQTQMEILNAIPAHVALVDPEGVILVTNESWRRFATANLLQGPEFSLGQNYLKVCESATGPCSDEARDAAAGIRRVLRGEVGEFSIEYPCHSPTEQRWFRLMATPLREGLQAGAVVMHVNITERKLAEVKLAQTTDMLERTGELAKVGGWSVNLGTMKLSWSRETFRIAELETLEEPALEDAINFYAPEARPVLAAAVQAAIATGTPYDLELPLITAKGNRRWVQTQGFAERKDGKVVRIYGTFQDITARKESEEALRTIQERFSNLVNSTDGIVWEADATTFVFTTVSHNAERMLGHSVADWLQPGFWVEHIHPDDRSAAVEYCAACTGRAEDHDFEYRFTASDGRIVWLRDIVRVVAEGGKVRWLRGLMIDITAQKLAGKALRESEERYRTLVEHSPYCIHEIDVAGRLTSMNGAGLKMMGVDDVCLILETPYLDAVGPRDRARIAGLLAGALAGQASEFTFQGNNGLEFQSSFVPITDAQGIVHRLMGLSIDITARNQAELELRESEERFRQLAENIQEVFWISDVAKNQILYISPAYEKVWGRTCAQLYQHPRSWLEAIYPEDRPRIQHAAETKQALGLYDETYRILRSDGEVRWIHDEAYPVTGPTGEVQRIVGTAEDITARVALEEQVRQSQKLKTIGTLAAGIAHDFNNILAAILVNAELALMDTAPEHPARESLNGIKIASERAKGLVQQIMAFSSQQPMERHSLALGPMVLEVAKLLRATIPAGVRIDTSVAPDAPPVLADATQMHQILVNLCTNAWHALGDQLGCIEVNLRSATLTAEAASRIAGLRPGRFACLSVRDNGKGMDAATLKRIFDPFFTTKEPGKGTGLGLSVVHGIVRGYQGAIQVVSQPGEGATFTLYFPAFVSAPASTVPGGKASSSSRDTSRHILYVDDDESLLFAATRTLERLGHRVSAFVRPADAVKAFRDNPGQFDLAVTDMNMPEVTGLAFAQELLKVRADLPIMLVSGNIEEGLRHAAREAGIRGILCKPFKMDEISEAIHRLAAHIQPT